MCVPIIPCSLKKVSIFLNKELTSLAVDCVHSPLKTVLNRQIHTTYPSTVSTIITFLLMAYLIQIGQTTLRIDRTIIVVLISVVELHNFRFMSWIC